MAARSPSRDPLFSDITIHVVLEDQMGRALMAVDEYSEYDLLAMGAGEATADLVSRFRVEVPAPIDGAISVSSEEADVDIRLLSDRDLNAIDRPTVRGTAVTYYVPFSGNADLFEVSPSTVTATPPRGIAVGQELHFRYEWPANPKVPPKTTWHG